MHRRLEFVSSAGDHLNPTMAILVLVLFLCSHQGFGQSQSGWRFWTADQGLAESYIRNISVDAEGRVWLTNGAIKAFTLLDGHTVRPLPFSLTAGHIQGGRGGEAWAQDGSSLIRFQEGKWISYSSDDLKAILGQHTMRGIYPVGMEEVILVLADRILLFRTGSRQTAIVAKAEQTNLGSYTGILGRLDGDSFWVSAERGVLAAVRAADGPQGFRLQEFRLGKPSLSSVGRMHEGDEGELFVAAQEEGKPVILRLIRGSWERVFSAATGVLEGWRGPDRSVWIRQDDGLAVLEEGLPRAVDRRDALSGTLLCVSGGHNGEFWIGTSQGLVHYSPGIWRSPSELRKIDEIVPTICEDRKGRVWAAIHNALAVLEGDRWRMVQLPSGVTTRPVLPQALQLMPDGRIAIATDVAGGLPIQKLVLLDPETGRFEEVSHPEGMPARLICRRRDGAILVQCGANTECRVDVFDGKTFHKLLDLGTTQITEYRELMETSTGDLWIGGLTGAILYRNGKAQFFGFTELGENNGVFSMFDAGQGKVLVGGRKKVVEYDGQAWRVLLDRVDRARSVILAQNGDIWVGSSNGIHRYHDGHWISNTVEDGLASSMAYKVFQDSRGRLYAGTTRGLALYHPEADRDPPESSIPADRNLRESAPDGNVRLVFFGSDKWKLTTDDRLLFSWGIDDDPWKPFVAENSASYEGLGSGKHRFRVRAMDRNGNIGSAPAVFEFTVLGSWYLQPGFLIIAGLAGLVIFFQGRRTYMHFAERGRMIEQLTAANEQVQQHTADLASANDAIRNQLAERQRAEQTAREGEERIRQLYQKMSQSVSQLNSGVGDVAAMATELADGSAQISKAGESLASGAGEQAAAVEEISSNLKVVTAATQQTAEHAEEVDRLAEAARASTANGVSQMQDLSGAIEKIKASSDQIGGIIKVIRELAFQTNMLSLNAAIEAARAGDAGRGFAVVAEEVRNLSLRSAAAARETETLIEEAQRNAERGVNVHQGVVAGLEGIQHQVEAVSRVLKTVNSTLRDQRMQIQEISRGMDQINRVTQSNAGSAEESASAAAEIAHHAARLQNLVRVLSSALEDLDRLPGTTQPATNL